MKRLLVTLAAVAVCVCVSSQTMDAQRAARKLEKAEKIANAARSLENPNIEYDPAYVKISFPNGDVPEGTGVCADVVIRALRIALGRDLQESIYLYRKAKGLSTDTNIDHRRVRNIVAYMDDVCAISSEAGGLSSVDVHGDLKAGDIVVWRISGSQLHIGIMVSSTECIHNICCGQVIECEADLGLERIRVYRE